MCLSKLSIFSEQFCDFWQTHTAYNYYHKKQKTFSSSLVVNASLPPLDSGNLNLFCPYKVFQNVILMKSCLLSLDSFTQHNFFEVISFYFHIHYYSQRRKIIFRKLINLLKVVVTESKNLISVASKLCFLFPMPYCLLLADDLYNFHYQFLNLAIQSSTFLQTKTRKLRRQTLGPIEAV